MDTRRIVRQWRQGGGVALVTLVRIEGSSYRRVGARMLIAADGQSTGTISGGCLESEVVRKAQWKVRDGAVVETYSTLFDDTAEIPFGLGCGGVVDLLLEPATSDEATALLEAMEASLAGRPSRVLTWLPGAGLPLRRAVLGANGEPLFKSAALGQDQVDRALKDCPGDVFPEELRAPQRLVIFGAGDDARPMVTAAALLGWSLTVVDGRAQLARPNRFPEASAVVAGAAVAQLGLGAQDAAVLMSHSYEQDRAWLSELLRQPAGTTAGYIGLLGSRHRSAVLVSEVAAALGMSVDECCARVWAPVGLDLGGDGPEAIALAIIAEVQAWVHGRLARSRRLDAAEVALQIARGGRSAYLQTHQCAAGLDGA